MLILSESQVKSLIENLRVERDKKILHKINSLSNKQSIEQHITEDIPQDIQITIVDSNGNEKVNKKSLDNFKFKDLAG